MKKILPPEEPPYEIPDNWHWAMVGDVVALHRGVSFTKDDVHKAKQADDVLIIRGGNVKEGYIDLETDNVYISKNLVSETQIIKKNDIIVVASTASVNVIGRAGIADRDYSDVACGGFLMLVRPSKNVIPSYVDYFFQSDFYRKRIRNLAAGTNINNIRNKHILDTPIPLPSLDEQKRISGRIESLFAKLNRARAFAQNVVDGYELRKGKILHEAFTGQLTNSNIDDWQNVKWLSCVKKMQNGVSKRIGDEGKETIVLRLCDLKGLEINLSNARKISLTDSEQEIYLLHKNDVLMIRVNGSKGNVGKQILITTSNEMAFCDHLIRIQFNENVLPKYMIYLSQHRTYKNYILKNVISTAGQYTISRKRMADLDILIPNIEEQKDIVRHLDSLLTKEQQTKELAEQTLQKIDLMKKTILARAFRGKL